MDIPANVVDKDLYRQVKKRVWKKYAKPSAYRSGALVKEYKRLGGRYKGTKPVKKGISRWFKEEWIDVDYYLRTGKKKPCGRQEVNEKYCRPYYRVDTQTPITVREATKESLRENVRRKKRGLRAKKLIRG